MQKKIGVALMVLGVLVYAGWYAWTRTRKMDPVDDPIVISAGETVSRSFRLNYDGHYLIEIAAEKKGYAEGTVERLGTEWVVWSAGREVSHGSTDYAHSAPAKSGEIVRVLGEFNGRAGQSYELRVSFTKAGAELQTANPRLKVKVSGLAEENLNAASVLLFSIVFICELFGMILVGVGLVGRRGGSATGITKAGD